MTTYPAVKALATTAGTAAALAAPLVALDVMNGTAPGMTPTGPMPHRCATYCRDCDRLAEAAALAAADEAADGIDLDVVAQELLALTDEELAALDSMVEGDETEVEVEAFPDGMGWDWPGTDWHQRAPF